MDLHNKNVALVGVGGIGKEIVRVLSGAGVKNFFLGDYKSWGIQDIKDSMAEGTSYHSKQLDVADAISRESWFSWVQSENIPIHIFIYTAGVMGPVGITTLPVYDDIVKTTEINYLSALYFVNRFTEEFFRPQKFGRIITIGSMAGYIPTPAAKTYDASKAALNTYMEAFAATMQIWHGKNQIDIKSNNLALRVVDTNMTQGMSEKDKEHEFGRFKQTEEGFITAEEAALVVMHILKNDIHGSIPDGTGFDMREALKSMRESIPLFRRNA